MLAINKRHPLDILSCRHTGIRRVATTTSHVILYVWIHILSLQAPKRCSFMVVFVTTKSRMLTTTPIEIKPFASAPASAPSTMAPTERIKAPATLILNFAFMHRFDLGWVWWWLGCRLLHYGESGHQSWGLGRR